ncbi:ABC transporter permease [Thermoanaerobacterium sp. CMT5567-10]|uniref:ABC transporter permease n=1 Tax=Thermoanaerobacterium sp. CMT5567-10 TaxID=3061989 RepID=UPI0026DEA925|nr:ABC transporter permease [Thermoanaerobacterium sp. CMT5567-10]WKV08521.1 ABC transporter permease [Thermoanaerobacterium sp. CMT5567-10]
MTTLRELYEYREMLFSMVKKDLRTRYRGSFLGFLWTFINPLLQLVVYSIVFSTIMRMNIYNFAMFLFVALLPWIFFSTSITQSTTIVMANSNLVKKIYFPRIILPISVALTGFINMLFGFIIVFIALFIFKIHLSYSIVLLPIVMINELVFVIGLSVIFSALNVFFRDLEHILGIVTMAWFYLTPIVFPINLVPERYFKLFFLNPMTSIILPYRDILYYGLWPSKKSLLLIFLMSICFDVFAFILFDRLQRRFAEEI